MYFVILIIGFIFFLILLFQQVQNKENGKVHRPYLSKKPLTPTETKFYNLLVKTLPDLIVLAQVQLSSFIEVDKKRIGNTNYMTLFNPISQQSVDFLICEKDFSIVAAVELDDKTHLNVDAIVRDTKKNKNLDAANVPLIRWHAESMPDTVVIKQTIMKYTKPENTVNSDQSAWLVDQNIVFLKSKKSNLLPWVFYVVIILALLILLIPALTHSFTQHISQTIQKPALTNQDIQVQPSSPSHSQIATQNVVQEIDRKNVLEEQRARLQNQKELNKLQINEDSKKEDAWKNYFIQKGVDCSDSESMVTCGNRYIKSRAQFEKDWQAKQTH